LTNGFTSGRTAVCVCRGSWCKAWVAELPQQTRE
jgi:hypothetical protein